jgi:hypothetical protein
MIQPIISLEMPVPSQGHYGFHSFPVVDWFCHKTKDRVTRTPLTQVLRKGSSSCSTSDTRRVNLVTNKGNNKITELRTILQRESQNSISI